MSIAACRLPGCPWRLTAICLGADEVAQRFFDAAFELNQIAFVGHGTPPSARPSSATSLIRRPRSPQPGGDRHEYHREKQLAYEALAAQVARIIDPQHDVIPMRLHDTARIEMSEREVRG
jgi:hypothetical protein